MIFTDKFTRFIDKTFTVLEKTFFCSDPKKIQIGTLLFGFGCPRHTFCHVTSDFEMFK